MTSIVSALLISLGIVIVVILGMTAIVYNTFVTMRNNTKKAWANIDVLLQNRYDLIGRLAEVVKGYMQYEKTVLLQVTDMRSLWDKVQNGDNIEDKINTSNQISNTLKTLFANIENYPELKADHEFMQLQKEMIVLENRIANRREFYNDTINQFNIKISVFPYLFLANALKYKPLPYFQAPDNAKQAVNVSPSTS